MRLPSPRVRSTSPGSGIAVGFSIAIPDTPPQADTLQLGNPNRASSVSNRIEAIIGHSQTKRTDEFTRVAHRKDLEVAILSMEQWAQANDRENALLQETVALAKGLFLATIAPQYSQDSANDELDTQLPEDLQHDAARVGKSADALAVTPHDDRPLTPRSVAIAKLMGSSRDLLGGTEEQHEMQNSVMRAAVSCLLLERICSIFGRYHSVLSTISDMIVRSVFVPDTEEMRRLLGSVAFPLRGVPVKYRSLLAPYARKTYFVAHDEVAAQVMALAKSNRAVEMRLSRQGKIFDVTVKHWVSSIVRNLFLSWRQFTRKRKTLCQKFQTKFARLRVEELKSRSIQNWRDRAITVRRASAQDAGAAEIAQLTHSTEQLHEMIVSLTDLNNNVSQRIMRQEKERQDMLATIAAKEKQFVELQSRTVEMDRVGTELLDSMLLAELPPRGNSALEVLVAWGHRMIDDAGGPIDGSFEPLAPLLSDEFSVTNVPLSSLASVMIRFNNPEAPTREEALVLHGSAKRAPKMLVDMYERVTGGPSLVNEDQIASMQRGILLLYLAGLMRHMSNWVVNKPYVVPATRKKASERTLEDQLAMVRRHQSSVHLKPLPTALGIGDSRATASSDEFEAASLVPAAELAPQHVRWLERVKIQQQWIVTSMAALHLALEASTQRPVALTSEEQEDMVAFLDLSIGSVFDLLPKAAPDTVFVQLLKSLQQLFPELRKVYLSYAVPAMHYIDFIRMAKDCRLVGANKLKKRELEVMCRDVFMKYASTAAAGASASKRDADEQWLDDTNDAITPTSGAMGPALSLGRGRLPRGAPADSSSAAPPAVDVSIKLMEPKVFTECIIRAALLYHRRLSRDKHLDLSVNMVSSFILETVVPHALRLDVDRFRQTARHPLVRQVLSRHKVSLRRAFRKYASVNDGEAIPRTQLHAMAKDCRWLNKVITTDVINEIYRRCLSGQDGDGSSEGLDLSEWHEALCALAVFADPNPLVPLYTKLPAFLEEKVLSALQV